MKTRTLRRAGLLGLAASIVMAGSAVAAPAVTLSIPDSDAGAPMNYSYTASAVPAKAQLVIQRAMGTKKHFGTVANLANTPTGTGQLPAQARGQYRFRIAVIGKKKVGKKRKRHTITATLTESKVTATVYGTLTFAQFFNDSEETLSLPSRSFTYVFSGEVYGGNEPRTLVSVSAEDNRCRSIHIDWAARNYSQSRPSNTAQLSVIQESRDAVLDTAVNNEISAMDAALIPGESWGINLSNLTPEGDLYGYANGTLSCY